MENLNVFMALMPKEVRINVRTSPETKRNLEVAAKLKGMTVSTLVNWAVTQIIREEKEREPKAFTLTPVHTTLHITNAKTPETRPIGNLSEPSESEAKRKIS